MSPYQLKLNIKRIQEMWLRTMEQKRLSSQQTSLRKRQQEDFDSKMQQYIRSPRPSFKPSYLNNKNDAGTYAPKKMPLLKNIKKQPFVSSLHTSFFNLYLNLLRRLRVDKHHQQHQLTQEKLRQKKQMETNIAEQERTQRLGL